MLLHPGPFRCLCPLRRSPSALTADRPGTPPGRLFRSWHGFLAPSTPVAMPGSASVQLPGAPTQRIARHAVEPMLLPRRQDLIAHQHQPANGLSWRANRSRRTNTSLFEDAIGFAQLPHFCVLDDFFDELGEDSAFAPDAGFGDFRAEGRGFTRNGFFGGFLEDREAAATSAFTSLRANPPTVDVFIAPVAICFSPSQSRNNSGTDGVKQTSVTLSKTFASPSSQPRSSASLPPRQDVALPFSAAHPRAAGQAGTLRCTAPGRNCYPDAGTSTEADTQPC